MNEIKLKEFMEELDRSRDPFVTPSDLSYAIWLILEKVITCPECNEPIEIGSAEEYGHKETCSRNG